MGARHLDLLRRWDIRPDPDDAGLSQAWWQDAPRDGWTTCRTDEPWQHALGHDFHGVAWYRRRARLPRRWIGGGQRVWLRFGAVATDCRVWVNGHEVGTHQGDYVPFEFDITAALGESERCEIVCRVDEIQGRPPKVWGEEPWGGHITKGFHDVLSLQHGGIWGGVEARVTGPIAVRSNGLVARPDAETGDVRVEIEFAPHEAEGEVRLWIAEPGDGAEHEARIPVAPGQRTAAATIRCDTVLPWSPDAPNLGRVSAVVRTAGVGARDEAEASFAFRTVEVGGRDHRRILLNGAPLLIRGMLDWSVQRDHIAPAPTPDEIRETFTALRERGFNCVCLCMVYPPDYFYDIADETGMLLWQIHPVWKSSMAPEHLPEYRRLFAEFLRRDRRHPSVFLVSATCEHERFDEGLARWWWDTSREQLPGTLLQVQTGFLQWSDTERMDLFDEHVYDNTGRWICYFEDLQRFLEARPARPFVMGETIIGTHWPDTAALLDCLGDDRPWWAPKGLDGFVAFESRIAERFGDETLRRFRAQGDAFALALRKSQSEIIRWRPHHAGWVMNHLCDVRVCQCGFTDDLGRWRFSPDDLRSFLSDRALLLRTPGFAVGVEAGTKLQAGLAVSNFSPDRWSGTVEVAADPASDGAVTAQLRLDVEPGEVVGDVFSIQTPQAESPLRLELSASADGVPDNRWMLWAFPRPAPTPEGVFVLDPSPRAPSPEPAFEERRYSSGWALECDSWRPRAPDAAALLPGTPKWTEDGAWPRHDDLTLVTTSLYEQLLPHLELGGRILLLAASGSSGPPARWMNLYGQVPLIVESTDACPGALLARGESGWLLDTLSLDLNRWSCRAVPSQEHGIADAVEPVVRLVLTHDKGAPEVWDQLFFARVGAGLLAVSTLDHDCPAGRYLLDRLIHQLHRPDAPSRCSGRLDPEELRLWFAPAAV